MLNNETMDVSCYVCVRIHTWSWFFAALIISKKQYMPRQIHLEFCSYISYNMCATSTCLEPHRCQTKDYKIGICCFSAKHAALRRKSKDWLAQNQNNVSEWSAMSTRRILFQWASTKNRTQHVGLEQSGPHHLFENELVLKMVFRVWFREVYTGLCFIQGLA